MLANHYRRRHRAPERVELARSGDGAGHGGALVIVLVGAAVVAWVALFAMAVYFGA